MTWWARWTGFFRSCSHPTTHIEEHIGFLDTFKLERCDRCQQVVRYL